MRIGIDLTWVKPHKNGGTEFYIRNLLDGFLMLQDENEYILFVSKDNCYSFEHYLEDKRFKYVKCNVSSHNLIQRVLWKNFFLYNKMKKSKIELAFFPVYDMPLTKCKSFYIVTTIHDIQALHYPQYFSKIEYYVLLISWKLALKHADLIISISDFVKKDLQDHFKNTNNIQTIYNPILINKNEILPFDILETKYGLSKYNYYYTVSSLLPHKNLSTILKVIENITNNNVNLPNKFLISGVGGKQKEELEQYILDNNLEENIVLTGFIDNDERNTLIKYCQCFLFPSIFEGFGMPPVEAMMLGTNVLATKKTSIEEVTQGKCYYVDNPYDVDEWIDKMLLIKNKNMRNQFLFPEYEVTNIAKQYLDTFYMFKK